MAQIIKSQAGEAHVTTDLSQPSNVVTNVLQKTIIIVKDFLDGEQQHPIKFVLDERFRETAIKELISRGEAADLFNPPNFTVAIRDLANFIEVDKQSNVDEEDRTPMYLSVLMQNIVYNPESVNNIIDKEFTEFI